MKEFVELKNVKNPITESETHIPSTMQADTLFTFTDKLEYITNYLRSSAIFPRYCMENIEYLNIANMRRIAIPMKCFCDITLHRLCTHLEWYGYYGLAFFKEWGMKRGYSQYSTLIPNHTCAKIFPNHLIRL